jgi:hypothetical protein
MSGAAVPPPPNFGRFSRSGSLQQPQPPSSAGNHASDVVEPRRSRDSSEYLRSQSGPRDSFDRGGVRSGNRDTFARGGGGGGNGSGGGGGGSAFGGASRYAGSAHGFSQSSSSSSGGYGNSSGFGNGNGSHGGGHDRGIGASGGGNYSRKLAATHLPHYEARGEFLYAYVALSSSSARLFACSAYSFRIRLQRPATLPVCRFSSISCTFT